jgi:GT2 family glycosyltransferase
MLTKHGIEQVGLFNEELFAYHEELDWCLTAGERGLVNLHVPGASAWHRDVGTKSELEQFQ